MPPPRLPRRALVASAALLAAPAIAQGERRAIRMIVPYPPGGASDIIARLIAPPMGETLGQTVVVENRSGANGGIAAEMVARAAPDGHTLLMGNAGPNALNQALYGQRLAYDSVRDFTPICLVSSVPMPMAVHPSFAPKTVQELIAHARANPGTVNYGTGGIGSVPHLSMAQLGNMTGVDWVHVAFRGGAANMTAIVGGQILLALDTAPLVLPHVRDGRLRGLAVTSLNRMPQAPELPTLAEQGFPGFEATSWGGVMGPARMQEAEVTRLHAAVARAMTMPEIQSTLARQGIEPRTSTPAEFAAHVASEVRRWTEVVRIADIKPE
jgi:tripartite-type tricarboxylate transporter receptor subunit TctC